MKTRTIMFQGTGSDVGKSLVVAGMCRLLARRGVRVAPFKAQNMSNNAAVTNDGGEIGRAQWLQAVAAGIEPSVHMNPILLKPQSDRTSQLIVRGKVAGAMGAQEYQSYRASLMPTVLESYNHLAKDAEIILVEGAGSPAETNLRMGDIANMGFARAVACPVIMIGDIDRGGVIASTVGTHTVLSDADRAMIGGFIINKFRGDAKIFVQGAKEIERRTGWPYLGLIPYNHALAQLPQEDSLALAKSHKSNNSGVHIVVLAYPHIANFDDIDPLKNEPDVRLTWLRAGDVLPADANLVILPGSKSTISDLEFVRAQGWDIDLKAHYRRGGNIIGICGGFQMLGKTLSDPQGFDGAPASAEGLGLLDISTVFTGEKTVTPWSGKYESTILSSSGLIRGSIINNTAPTALQWMAGSSPTMTSYDISGYEIHTGVSTGPADKLFTGEGARTQDDLIWGSYIHGLFANDVFRKDVLSRLGAAPSNYNYRQHMQHILDGWADILEQSVSIEQLLSLATAIAA